MAKQIIDIISTTDTYQEVINRTNEIIDYAKNDFVVVNCDNVGNVSLNGTLTANTVTYDTGILRASTLEARLNPAIDIAAVVDISSGNQQSISLTNSSGPRISYIAGTDKWESGFKDNSTNDYTFIYNNVEKFKITVIGDAFASTGTLTGSLVANSFIGPLTGNASTVTNGVYTIGNQTIDGTKTFSAAVEVPLSAVTTSPVNAARTISAGIGLAGGGNLATDITITLDGLALAAQSILTNGIMQINADSMGISPMINTYTVAITNSTGVSGNPTASAITAMFDDVANAIADPFTILADDKLLTPLSLSMMNSRTYGTKWAPRTSPTDKFWSSIATNSTGTFCAVASGGSTAGKRIMSSYDAVQWTTRTTPNDNEWTSICWGTGMWVAVAKTGSGNRAMSSPDGVNWTARSSAANNNWASVCYGNGKFVAVADSGSGNRVMTSTNGATWTIRTSAADNSWASVCYGNGLFVAVGNSVVGTGVMTSPDGITWTSRSGIVNYYWKSICYGNGIFVAVASSGSGAGANKVMTSTNGITWTLRAGALDRTWNTICWNGSVFVVSGLGVLETMVSLDGINWRYVSSLGGGASAIAWNGSVFAGVLQTPTTYSAIASVL